MPISKLYTEHITKSYTNNNKRKPIVQPIIDDINIHLNQGETVSLLGPSGIGKTTLFNIITGLYKPDCGRVFLDGADVTGKSGFVGYMMQKDLLLPYKKVIDNVSLPLILRGEKKQAARMAARPLFKQFGLEGCENKYPAQLSGGMRQRAALMRTYFFGGTVVLLDEPFSALDAITKYEMQLWYVKLSAQMELSTFFITHDIDEAIFLSDRIYMMSASPDRDAGGKITGEYTIAHPRHRDKSFVLSSEFLNYKTVLSQVLYRSPANKDSQDIAFSADE